MTEYVDLLTPEAFAKGPPHHVFDRLRRLDPIHGQPNPRGGTIWSLTRSEDIRKVSGDVETFCSRGGLTLPITPERLEQTRTNLMFNDPPFHTRLRAFVAKAFSPPVVARFDDWISELCVKILDDVEATGGAPFDAVKMISAALPSQVIASILGVHDKDRDAMVHRTMIAFGDADPEIGVEGSMKAYADTMAYALELRDWKLREPAVDMATELAFPPDDCSEPLSGREYAEMITTFMTAGFETTHSMIAQTLILMAQNPDNHMRLYSYNVTKTQLPALVQSNVSAFLDDPGTSMMPRVTQMDLAFSKVIGFGKLKLTPQVDVFNLLNNNAVLTLKTAYGATLGYPSTILSGRLVRFQVKYAF